MVTLGERRRVVQEAARGTLYVVSPSRRKGLALQETGMVNPDRQTGIIHPGYNKFIHESWIGDAVNEIRVSPQVEKKERDKYLNAATSVLTHNYDTFYLLHSRRKSACIEAVYTTIERMSYLHGLQDFKMGMRLFVLDKGTDTEASGRQTGQFVMTMQIPNSSTILTLDPGAYLFDFPNSESAITIGDIDFTTRMFNDIYSRRFPGSDGIFTEEISATQLQKTKFELGRPNLELKAA
jgi:hypothetical protein